MTQRKQMQTAYLQPDLLPASDFVSYCRDNGIDTDLDELEYFDRESLLVPAARVRVGIVKYRRIYAAFNGTKEWRYVHADDLSKLKYEKLEKETYFDRGALIRSTPFGNARGFHYGNDGWLDWYAENDMVTFPSEDGYISWDTFEGGGSFSLDPKPFEEVGYVMYTKQQMYPLVDVKRSRTITISNSALFRTPEEWSKAGAKITEMFSKGYTSEIIRERTYKWCRFLDFLVDVRKLRNEKNARFTNAYHAAVDAGNKEYAVDDAREEAEFFDKEVKGKAKELLKQHGYELQEITDWRFILLGRGSFDIKGNSRRLRPYVARLDDGLLNATEETYNLVNVMSWFIETAGGEGITAKQLLLREMKQHCIICGRTFEAIKRNQVTCGFNDCAKKHQLQHKQLMRRTGKYKT